MIRILSVFGTRPEAIKMAPVIKELEKYAEEIESIVCVTAQHREMLDQVLSLFDIRPAIDLNLMEEGQSPASVTARAVTALSAVLNKAKANCVLVQGDTTTAMAAALAAFYQRIPVAHVEAGLRTQNRYSPFPEEINRRLIGILANYHFAPTRTAASALRAEGTPSEDIFVTGNPVVDALKSALSKPSSGISRELINRIGLSLDGSLQAARKRARLLLVTAHRRENFGRPLENICHALKEIVTYHPDVQVIYPVHKNPNVQGPVRRMLEKEERICLIDPVSYECFARLMEVAFLILTDSGGIQEEAPALGKPVLVLRSETERPEAVEAGTVKVIGTEIKDIVRESRHLLTDRNEYRRMRRAVNPYGDGHAAERIVSILLSNFRHGIRRKSINMRSLPQL